ncbi:MAG: HNH endonuclease [Gemmatimonadota bacterium]|nr:HNH endonuclease [Gemmatimonadota bacterium]
MPNSSILRSDAPATQPRRHRRPRRRIPGSTASAPRHTSLPTSRTAYTETRLWLINCHGPVCAYCERRTDPSTITLDHVTPRRGQTAYDRRDNLVLACFGCNAQKADQPILAFLLARRARAASLLRYGQHLTPMLRNLAHEIAGPEAAARAARLADPDYPYRD